MTIEQFLEQRPEWRKFADLLVLPPTADEIRGEFPDADKDLVERCGEAVANGGYLLSRGALYVIIRRKSGDTDRGAAMLALNQPARGETSDTFWAGRKHFSQVYGEKYADLIRAGLARQGITLKPGDEYMPELVRPGMGFSPKNPDPEAVVPFAGARSYIKRLCEQRGWACEGAVSVDHRQPDSDPWDDRVPLADSIVNKSIKEMVTENPSLKTKSRAELREAVLAKHGPSK